MSVGTLAALSGTIHIVVRVAETRGVALTVYETESGTREITGCL